MVVFQCAGPSRAQLVNVDAGSVGERAAEPEDRLELLVPAEVDERYKTYRITELQNISFLFTETNTALVTLSPPPPFCQENWS